MAKFSLYITNKNYSSWSLRAWLILRAFDIPFEEIMMPMDESATIPGMLDVSGTGKVPCLRVHQPDGDMLIWESLAIAEYLAETYADRALWPRDVTQRARARVLSAEMHAGFTALRSACPMNLRRLPAELKVDAAVRQDVAAIESMWAGCYARHDGPFLCGDFSIVDAMYAPVYARFRTYQLSDHAAVARFGAALDSLPAWNQWVVEALQETAVIPADEVDDFLPSDDVNQSS